MKIDFRKKRGIREKLAYVDKLMGSVETVFAHYRVLFFLEYLCTRTLSHDTVLLDVGCGAGSKMKNISKNFGRLTTVGMDISKIALMYAHRHNNKAHFLRTDAEELPARDESIDYIVSFDLLEHLPNPKKAMRECHRVLKRGGILHFFVPCEGEKLSILGRCRIFRSLTTKHAGHIQHFTKQQIRADLERVGFIVNDEKHSYSTLAQLVHLFSYLLVDLSGIGPDESGRSPISLVRWLIRILISEVDLILSERFPNHSMGYHITARK